MADDEQSTRCGRCGYDVRGLPSAMCPECGGDLREVGVVGPATNGWAFRAAALVVYAFVALVSPLPIVAALALLLPTRATREFDRTLRLDRPGEVSYDLRVAGGGVAWTQLAGTTSRWRAAGTDYVLIAPPADRSPTGPTPPDRPPPRGRVLLADGPVPDDLADAILAAAVPVTVDPRPPAVEPTPLSRAEAERLAAYVAGLLRDGDAWPEGQWSGTSDPQSPRARLVQFRPPTAPPERGQPHLRPLAWAACAIAWAVMFGYVPRRIGLLRAIRGVPAGEVLFLDPNLPGLPASAGSRPPAKAGGPGRGPGCSTA